MKQGGASPVQLVIYTDDALLAVGALNVLSAMPERFRALVADPGLCNLVPFVEQIRPDVILLDLTPEVTLGLISTLREVAPAARLVLWGRSFSEELRYQASEIGVAGFLARGVTSDEFCTSLTGMAGGQPVGVTQKPSHSKTVSLTNRESQLVTLLVQGLKNKEIAACIGIAESTVRIYLSRLFAKIGARDRFEVAVFGLKNSYCGQASWDGQNAFVTETDADRARPVLRSLVLVEPQRRRGYVRRAAVGE
jgi:DNA-binding NarL/FixJ family response regulator